MRNDVLIVRKQKSVFLIERGNNEGIEFDGCKKEWTLGTPVSIVRMIKKRG